MAIDKEPSGAEKMFGDFAPGWPKAMAAMAVAKQVFRANRTSSDSVTPQDVS